MEIFLTPEQEQFVNNQIQNGLFLTTDEVIREGLRLLEERERLRQWRLDELRQQVAIGIQQADRGEVLDGAEVFKKLREKFPDLPEQEA